ncbi:MAG TPA: YkgJ family cysteine cluster protein [Kofleriaceae bacterium]|nr:YkgJ family cysteine cluster protein [Kofleriaceae bacterium]
MSSSGRPAVLAVLADADRLRAGWSCDSSADCCQFDVTGREPYLTEAEWRVVEAELARQGRRIPAMPDSRVCPFLDGDHRCTIYAARPLGCRTFYCHRASGPHVPRRDLADLTRRLEVLSADPEAKGRSLSSWLTQAGRSSRSGSRR